MSNSAITDNSLCMQVFTAIAIFLGDGLYNLVKMVIVTARNFKAQQRARENLPTRNLAPKGDPFITFKHQITRVSGNCLLSCSTLQ